MTPVGVPTRIMESSMLGKRIALIAVIGAAAAILAVTVTVVPTVVFLDTRGEVLARREGESSATLSAVSADLAKREAAR